MRRTALLLAALLGLSALPACSKCDVPTYGGMACTETPKVR